MREAKILPRRANSQRVQLLNGTSFLARYERIGRKNLPRNITVKQSRKIGPRRCSNVRRRQTGAGIIGNLAEWGINMVAKAINSGLGKKLFDEEIKHAPEPYKYGTSEIKNQNIQRALYSDVLNYIATETQNKRKDSLNNLFGGV